MIDWLATLAAKGARRPRPAAAIWHYLAGKRARRGDERTEMIPEVQRLVARLIAAAR